MNSQLRTVSPDSWRDEVDLSQRPPTSSTSDFSDHSFHSRSKSSAHVNSPKRLSMFSSARSRSNTTNLTSAASRQLPAVALNYSESQPSPALSDEKSSDKAAKSLLVRGSRILRRQGSKVNIAAALEEEDELGKGAARFEVTNLFHRVPKLKRNDSHDQLKRLISDPYNFHHLTHTSSSQFHELDNANNVDLVDEFSAMQASQTPEPGLKGIRAQALSTEVSFNERESYFDRPVSTSPLRRSPPISPLSPISPISPKGQRTSPGRIENFSRPVSRMNKQLPVSPTMIPPPRVSSWQVQTPDIPEPSSLVIDKLLGLNSMPNIPDYEYPQLDNTSFRKVSSLERIDLMFQSEVNPMMSSSQNENINSYPTEEDTKARAALINSYLSDLDDVPEEDETKDIEQSIAHMSRAFSLSLREKEDEPVINTAKSSMIILQNPFSDEILSPTLPQFQSMMQDSPSSQYSDNMKRRPSVAGVDLPMTWEEDIDYCYEHEAEANCEFDWNRRSLDNQRKSIPGIKIASSTADIARSRLLNNQLNDNSVPTTPDLDRGSAQSVLTRSQEALTPLSDGAVHGDFFSSAANGHEYLSKLPTHDAETVYENFLSVSEDVDGQFQYYTKTNPQPVDVTSSPRSSSSKYTSEGSALSRTTSIVRKHRSSTSTTDVPELTNSANSSRENTIRESFELPEHPMLTSETRSGFSIHRPVKSLGSELTALSKLRTTDSNGSIHVVDLPSTLPSPVHDRTKSASAIDHDDTHKFQEPAEGLSFAARQSLAQRRKSRGYSLFPVAQ